MTCVDWKVAKHVITTCVPDYRMCQMFTVNVLPGCKRVVARQRASL